MVLGTNHNVIEELYLRHGLGQATFYRWRSKGGALPASALRRVNEPYAAAHLKPHQGSRAAPSGRSMSIYVWHRTEAARIHASQRSMAETAIMRRPDPAVR